VGKLWIWVCFVTVFLSFGIIFSSDDSFIFRGNPLSFLKSFKDVKLTFPTNIPDKNVTIKLKTRPGLIRPNLKAALEFLKSNYSHMEEYKNDIYDCKQFALRIYDDAQLNNFEVKYVIISLLGQSEGHALAAIQTSDAGLLYVDFTPFILMDRAQKPSRTVAQVEEGKPYVRVPIDFLDKNFRNEPKDFQAYQVHMHKAEGEITQYNDQLTHLENRKKSLEGKIGNFNSKVSKGVTRDDAAALKREQDSLQREVEEVNNNFDILNVKENLLKKSYSTLDWIGKDWIVQTVKLVP
jgi:hypothetical protein